MVFGCLIFSALANKFGLRNILLIGTLGYAPYSAALYVNNRYGTQWPVLLGGATCGIAASALWASEGAIALGYPETRHRSKYTGIWLGLRELGQLIGAAIQLSLNMKSSARGKVGYTTYLVLISLQCLGLPLALLVSSPEKIVRSDGSKVSNPTKSKAVLTEFRKLWVVLKQKHILLILPVLVTFQWNSTYQSIYLTTYFSVRSRTLGALTAGIAATAANFFWGWFLDLKFFSRPKLAKICWFFSCIMMTGLFSWQIANEYLYSHTTPKITIDWDKPGFGRAFAANVLFRFMNESNCRSHSLLLAGIDWYALLIFISDMFVYFMMGAFYKDIETLTLTVGIIRSFESIGSCLAFGIGASKGVSPMVNLIVAFVMFAIAVPPTTVVTFWVPEHPANKEVAFEELEEPTK